MRESTDTRQFSLLGMDSMFSREDFSETHLVSDFSITAVNEMKDVLEHFHLPFENATTSDFSFYVRRVHESQTVDFNGIALSNLSGDDIYTIAMKFFQPIDVINEVLKKGSDIGKIVECKTYKISSITGLFGKRSFCSTGLTKEEMKGIKRDKSKTNGEFSAKGKVILRNRRIFNSRSEEVAEDGRIYISGCRAYKEIFGTHGTKVYTDERDETFGIKIATMDGEYGTKYLLSDCRKAKIKKRSYIRRKKIECLAILNNEEVRTVRSEFLLERGYVISKTWVSRLDIEFIEKLCSARITDASLVSVSTISSYRQLSKGDRTKAVKVLKAKGMIAKPATSNKPNFISGTDRREAVDIFTSFKKTGVLPSEAGVMEIARVVGFSHHNVKSMIDNGEIFGIKVKAKKSGRISREDLEKIRKEREKYININSEGLLSNLISPKRMIVRKEFKEYIRCRFFLLVTKKEEFISRINEEMDKTKRSHLFQSPLYETRDAKIREEQQKRKQEGE